jgi:hypothetical protein
MNRRDLLKLAPVAALAPTTLKIGEREVPAYEVSKDKRYIIVLRNASSEEVEAFARDSKHLGFTVMCCGPDHDLELYELTK